MGNKIILMVFLLLVAYLFVSQEEETKKLPIKKEVVAQKRVESLEQVKKEVVEKKIKSNQKVIFYPTKEINTTMKTEINLTSEFDENGEDYSYIWKEKENIIGFGRNIKKAFSLGEHNLSCQIFNAKGILLAKEPINVIAWRYIKEEHYSFDSDIDKYSLIYINFFNYLKQLVLEIYSNDYKKEFTYNKYGKITEERYESFDSEKYNYITTNSYDEERLLSVETTDNDGNIMESHFYDEEGKEIEQEVDEDTAVEEDKLDNDSDTQKKPIKVYNKDGNLTHFESADGHYTKDMQYEKGRLIYSEVLYFGNKTINRLRYDENGRENYDEYLKLDKEGNIKISDIITKVYNDEGELIRKERKYSIKKVLVQHTIDKWSYKDGKKLSHKIEALVGFCPCTIDIVKEEYIYNYDKNGSELAYDYKFQKKGDSEWKKPKEDKVVKTYTNDLE
ncbi:hypothetical protein MNB_SV-12-969 [hydrothermal vent metagenome]|uniref:Uncharacterized protein n=1 Tax=hydrothermal vent metagenome TaxID=652676 RepID=A0A1W1BMT0_9ZZZZ